MIPELSADWPELADAQYKDMIAIPDPEKSGACKDFLAGFVTGTDDGEAVMQSWAGNGLTVPGANKAALEAVTTGVPYQIGGNVMNNGLITNLPSNAVVEVPCLVDANGVQGTYVGALPPQCAAMNMTNINVQLLTIEAALTLKREHIYHAAMLDPHTSSELNIDDIIAMCDDLIEAHGNMLPKYH